MSRTAPRRAAAGGETAVMIVDDQAVFRKVARAVIEGAPGFALVAEAASGGEALRHADTIKIDLVLMDVRMPDMDGIETTRLLVASHPNTVVVLISLEELSDVVTAASDCGAVAFVRKQDFCPRMLRDLWDIHGRVGSVN
jgi:two-component system, NarL family, invasion response regulator UvrY